MMSQRDNFPERLFDEVGSPTKITAIWPLDYCKPGSALLGSIFVVISFTLALVAFSTKTQFMELSALSRRVLGVPVERAG